MFSPVEERTTFLTQIVFEVSWRSGEPGSVSGSANLIRNRAFLRLGQGVMIDAQLLVYFNSGRHRSGVHIHKNTTWFRAHDVWSPRGPTLEREWINEFFTL
jgi:hypothetical protein